MALTNTETTFLYLISCAVNGRKPDIEIIKAADRQGVYTLCRQHFVTATGYYAMLSAWDGTLPEGELFAKWKQDRDLVVWKMLLFDMEYERVAAYLESSHIWHVRLKGAEIQKFYPVPEMRETSDVDILFDESRSEIVKQFFLDSGYILGSEIPSHYEFLKKPVYNFEMHKLLFDHLTNPTLYDYYRDIKAKLLLRDGTACTYVFTPEDHYVFCMAHEYKHYTNSGIGVRSLMDCYMMRNMPAEFDWEYAAKEMEKLGIRQFHDSMVQLAVDVFSDPDALRPEALSAEAQEMLDRLIRSGVFGNELNLVRNRMEAIAKDKDLSGTSVKIVYIFRRLFPNREFFRAYYPEMAEKKYPLPFLWVYRIFRGLRKKRSQISAEIKTLRSSDVK